MSGVLFIICIPREEYEDCLKGKRNVVIEQLKSTLQKQESLSNDSDESSSTSKVS